MNAATLAAEERDARWRARLRGPVETFLRDLAAWRWWITLTFTQEVTEATALRLLRVWLRFVARQVLKTHATAAWAYGEQQRGVLHFHVLLAPHTEVRTFNLRACDRAWRRVHPEAGFLKIKSAHRRAPRYAAKHAEWDVNVLCPRPPACRRSGQCRYAPGPL